MHKQIVASISLLLALLMIADSVLELAAISLWLSGAVVLVLQCHLFGEASSLLVSW